MTTKTMDPGETRHGPEIFFAVPFDLGSVLCQLEVRILTGTRTSTAGLLRILSPAQPPTNSAPGNRFTYLFFYFLFFFYSHP